MENANGRLIEITHLLLLAGEGPEQIAAALQRLIAPAQAKDALNQGTENGSTAMEATIHDAANALYSRQETIHQIVTALYRLHPPTERLLLREAELAIQAGIRAGGRDREEHFKDAYGLLRRVAENPVSSRDYTLRFNMGWLGWKLGHPLNEVEEAFYQAGRLSSATAAPFHEYSLRHLSYLHYLRGDFQAAYDTANATLAQYPHSLDMRYDAARYAARTGRDDEAQQYLDICFSGGLIYLLLAAVEEDFETEGSTTPARIASTVERARRDLELALRAWRGALRVAREAEAQAEIPLMLSEIDEKAQSAAEEQYAILSRKDPLGVAALHRATSSMPSEVLSRAEAELTNALEARHTEAGRLHRQLQKLVDDLELWNASLHQLEDEASLRGYSLRAETGITALLWISKKQQRIQSARINYISCLQNLDAAERHYSEQAPVLEKAIVSTDAAHARLIEALNHLRRHSASETLDESASIGAEG